MAVAAVKIRYDPQADAAFIYLLDQIGFGEVARTQICDLEIKEGAVILAFDSAGMLIGVEVLGARKLLSSDVLDRAV